jgi:1,4-alpha-glucan branching enzyme
MLPAPRAIHVSVRALSNCAPTVKGYNTMLPFAVETDYGGPDALKDFVREAHSRGIAVILDVNYNHFGSADLGRSLWRLARRACHGTRRNSPADGQHDEMS